MEPKTEKKSIKNEVEKKMRKNATKECGGGAILTLTRSAWRNVGAAGEDLGGGKDRSGPGKTGTAGLRQEKRSHDRLRRGVQHAVPAELGGGLLRAFRRAGLF